MTRAVTLTSPGIDPLELDDWDEGWVVSSVETGSPQTREVVASRPIGHGTIDRTRFVGARAVTVGVALVEQPHALRQLLDRLAPYLDPGRRSTLTVSDGFDVRSLPVRAAGGTSVPWEKAGFMRLSLGWVSVGYPFWLGPERGVVLSPTAGAVGAGVIPPVTPPITLAAGPPDGMIVDQSGTIGAHWIAEIDGPVSDVSIMNTTTGEQVALTGLSIIAGQKLVVDSFARTVTVDGESRFAAVDTAISTWWTLPPGVSEIAAPASSTATPSQVWFRYADTFYL